MGFGEAQDAAREKGLSERALAAYAREEKALGRPSPGRAILLARQGKAAEAREIALQLEELSKTSYIATTRIAAVWAAFGDKDRAFAWIEKGIAETHDTWLLWIRASPDFDSLRSDARYPSVLRRVGGRSDPAGPSTAARLGMTALRSPPAPAGSVLVTCPLCPFREFAEHVGKGSTNDAANFVCQANDGEGEH